MCDERQSWNYKEPAVSLDLADGPSLFINFNELSENELESNFGLRSGASLNPYTVSYTHLTLPTNREV